MEIIKKRECEILKALSLLLALTSFGGCNQTDQTQELELFGHRGATGLLPENSIPGFKEALNMI